MKPLALLLSLAALLVACTPSVKADMVTICDVESLTRVDGETVERKENIEKMFILRNTHSDEAGALMQRVWGSPAASRPEILRAAATKAGLSKCALADAMEKENR